MAVYITRGTVQITMAAAVIGDLEIKINPSQDYTVKHIKKDYIIFMPNNAAVNVNAKVFEAPTKAKLPVTNNALNALVQASINAAFKSTNIEIVVDIDENNNNITVQSIKIPAAF